jgi:hypothetical protein
MLSRIILVIKKGILRFAVLTSVSVLNLNWMSDSQAKVAANFWLIVELNR